MLISPLQLSRNRVDDLSPEKASYPYIERRNLKDEAKMPKFKSTSEALKIVHNKDQIRNIGIIAHVDHGIRLA